MVKIQFLLDQCGLVHCFFDIVSFINPNETGQEIINVFCMLLVLSIFAHFTLFTCPVQYRLPFLED